MALIIASYFITVGFLLYVSYSRKLFKLYTVLKAAAGVCFIALAVCNINTFGIFEPLMLAAMFLCLAGDVLLGLANNLQRCFTKMFLAGVCAFAIAHIVFSAAFCSIASIGVLDIALSLLGFYVSLFITKQKSFRFAKMKIPVLIYSCLVGLMCARSISAFMVLRTISGALMAVGGILFLISDFSILFLYFTVKKPRRFVRVFNLLTYYAGLFCLALCL